MFCGPSMVFTNVYNPRSAVVRKDEYRRTLVRRGATLGANCTIVCGVTIGDYAFVGAGAVVNRDVPDLRADGRRAGAPDRLDEPHRRAPGLPLSGDGEATCPNDRRALRATRSTCCNGSQRRAA